VLNLYRQKRPQTLGGSQDRFSYYCVLDEAGEVLIEQKLRTTKAAMQQVADQDIEKLLEIASGIQRLIDSLTHRDIRYRSAMMYVGCLTG
jgi:hypothetical protein